VLKEQQSNDCVAGLSCRRCLLLDFDLKPVEVFLDIDPRVEISTRPVDGVDAVSPKKKGGTLTGCDDKDVFHAGAASC
jgi:hypothetical protein